MLEREFSKVLIPRLRCRLYETDFSSATDVQGLASISNAPSLKKVEKRLLYETTGLSMYEGLCLGPKLSDGARLLVLVSDGDKKSFWAFVNQDAYLSSHKGQYAEAYSVHPPMVHKFDLRVSQDFRIRIGNTYNTFQINADLMNFTNLMNDSWGVSRILDESAQSGQLLTFDQVNAQGQPVFKSYVADGAKTWMLSHSAFQTWYLQIGLKYMFN